MSFQINPILLFVVVATFFGAWAYFFKKMMIKMEERIERKLKNKRPAGIAG